MLYPYHRRIRNLRIEHRLTQGEIADILGISQRTYSDYERGKLRLPVPTLIALARYYNVSMNFISGTSNVRTPFPRS